MTTNETPRLDESPRLTNPQFWKPPLKFRPLGLASESLNLCIDNVYTMAEVFVTLRVPKELKEKMRRSKINWSEELRQTIKSKLESDRKNKAGEELEKLLVDIKPGFNSLEAIREARRLG